MRIGKRSSEPGAIKAAAAAAAAAAAEALEESPAQCGHEYSFSAAASAMERHGVHVRCTHELHTLQPTWWGLGLGIEVER